MDVPIIYFRSKFYVPNTNCLLVATIKIEA